MELSTIDTLVEQITQLGPAPALVLTINVLMLIVIRIPYVRREKDWLIPLIAILLGAIGYPQIMDVGKVLKYDVVNPKVLSYLYGILIGFAAVGTHQMFKKGLKKVQSVTGISTGDTEQTYRQDVKDAQKSSDELAAKVSKLKDSADKTIEDLKDKQDE